MLPFVHIRTPYDSVRISQAFCQYISCRCRLHFNVTGAHARARRPLYILSTSGRNPLSSEHSSTDKTKELLHSLATSRSLNTIVIRNNALSVLLKQRPTDDADCLNFTLTSQRSPKPHQRFILPDAAIIPASAHRTVRIHTCMV